MESHHERNTMEIVCFPNVWGLLRDGGGGGGVGHLSRIMLLVGVGLNGSGDLNEFFMLRAGVMGRG